GPQVRRIVLARSEPDRVAGMEDPSVAGNHRVAPVVLIRWGTSFPRNAVSRPDGTVTPATPPFFGRLAHRGGRRMCPGGGEDRRGRPPASSGPRRGLSSTAINDCHILMSSLLMACACTAERTYSR